MFFEVRKKASHHPKQKIKADHLSSCHNRCNENSWSSLFIVFMLCSIGGIKTFHIIVCKLLSVHLIFRFFVGISAIFVCFLPAVYPLNETFHWNIEWFQYVLHSGIMAFIPSSFKGSDLVPAHTVIVSKNTKKEQKMTTFCSFTLFSSLCTFSFGLRISSSYPHFGRNNTTPLRPGNPAAHPTCRLMLLPSGPDMIHRGESHETRTSSRNGRS